MRTDLPDWHLLHGDADTVLLLQVAASLRRRAESEGAEDLDVLAFVAPDFRVLVPFEQAIVK